MAESRLIESVARALDILELLDQEGELGITEIARRLGMEKSTVFRAVNTLKARHYVSQDPDTFRYSNSYKLFEMGHNVGRVGAVPKMAYRFMRQLAQSGRGAVHLGVRDGKKAVYVDKIEGEGLVKVCLKIGRAIPLYCTGLGKALLAFMPETELRELFGREVFQRFTEATHGDLEALIRDLAEIRSRGFSLDNEEHLPGVICVAAPVFNAKGETIAALSLAAPSSAAETVSFLPEMGRAVSEAAEGFTMSIGGRRPACF